MSAQDHIRDILAVYLAAENRIENIFGFHDTRGLKHPYVRMINIPPVTIPLIEKYVPSIGSRAIIWKKERVPDRYRKDEFKNIYSTNLTSIKDILQYILPFIDYVVDTPVLEHSDLPLEFICWKSVVLTNATQDTNVRNVLPIQLLIPEFINSKYIQPYTAHLEEWIQSKKFIRMTFPEIWWESGLGYKVFPLLATPILTKWWDVYPHEWFIHKEKGKGKHGAICVYKNKQRYGSICKYENYESQKVQSVSIKT